MNFADTNLSNAVLYGADLRGAILQGARLDRADLRGASLRGADLTGARLQDADMRDGVIAERDQNGNVSLKDIHAAFAAHYEGQKIVQLVPLAESAQLARVDAEELRDTDVMKLFVFGSEGLGQVNLVALLDNLGKGASGAAVQNLDLMTGHG